MIKVISKIEFDDYMGKDVNNKTNQHKHRKIGDIFDVEKERCEFLLKHGAIEKIVRIDRIVENVDKPKRTRKKKEE